MNFENCKQIEINGKVFDCEKTSWIDMKTPRLVVTVEGERYDMPVQFLEAIGAKPVVEMPKKGDVIMVRNFDDYPWEPRVATGQVAKGESGTFIPMVYDSELDFFEHWKPFNPEELE